MIRQVEMARDTAVKARTSAIITLKQIVVNAPAELREEPGSPGDKALIVRCAAFRSGRVASPIPTHRRSTPCGRWLAVGRRSMRR
jgi:hypothetical protein